MKPNESSKDDGKLHAMLREWQMDAPLPPRFQDQVWQRIARQEATSTASFWAGLARLMEVVLPRPKIAVSYLATLLVLGVTAGSVMAQIKSSRTDAALRAHYVQSVDPYQAETSQP